MMGIRAEQVSWTMRSSPIHAPHAFHSTHRANYSQAKQFHIFQSLSMSYNKKKVISHVSVKSIINNDYKTQYKVFLNDLV